MTVRISALRQLNALQAMDHPLNIGLQDRLKAQNVCDIVQESLFPYAVCVFLSEVIAWGWI